MSKLDANDYNLFSTNVIFRTGDSHSILSRDSNKRINPSKSIQVGNRVWFGNNVTILKGVYINDDNIIGTGSILTKSINTCNNIIAGIPAKIIKSGVFWTSERTTNF